MRDKATKTDLNEKKVIKPQNRIKRLQNIKEAAERQRMKCHLA